MVVSRRRRAARLAGRSAPGAGSARSRSPAATSACQSGARTTGDTGGPACSCRRSGGRCGRRTPGRQWHRDLAGAELLELYAGHGPGGVLDEDLVDDDGDVLAGLERALGQVGPEQLVGEVGHRSRGGGPALGSMARTWWPSWSVRNPAVGISEWRSASVRNPIRSTMPTRSSVAMRSPWRERQAAADPAGAGVQVGDPVEDGRVSVREPGVAGVVEVVAQRRLLADTARTRAVSSRTRSGVATPIVSARQSSSNPAAAPGGARSTTLSGRLRPRTDSRRRWPG